MRVWIDLANSPHVPLFRPLVERLRRNGDDVLLTARDHAQTLALARREWDDVRAVGGPSPAARAAKAAVVARRVGELRRFGRRQPIDAALSHGSYAQIVAARLLGVPAVTMMDYEHQPANHLSFRLASLVLVPAAFPAEAARRFGAGGRLRRYEGYKEELYLADARPDPELRAALGVPDDAVLAVMRPPPEGALYHGVENRRFDELLDDARERADVHVLVVPRDAAQAARYGELDGVAVAPPADGASLLLAADLVVGAGGTMNRESALLGTPTYTVFAGRLAALDARLIEDGRLVDLRSPGTAPAFVRRPATGQRTSRERADAIAAAVLAALAEAARC